jgi:flagellin-like hook-associated protein FlgL
VQNLDLIRGNSAGYGDNDFEVLIGNGSGGFSASSVSAPSTQSSLDVGDVDGDGVIDLVSTDGNGFWVLKGNGDGTFQPSVTYNAATPMSDVRVKDVNGDGILDVLAITSGAIAVSTGKGDGTFNAAATYSVGPALTPNYWDLGDVNGDGVLDAAVFNSDTEVSVLLGNGSQRSTSVVLRPISGLSVATRADALAAQGAIDSYLGDVTTVRGAIGSSMSRLEVALTNMQTAVVNVDDAQSRIMDVDVAEEAARVVKDRILQQAGVAVLAQANQGPALALKLLKSP